jgi:hypothetical protein
MSSNGHILKNFQFIVYKDYVGIRMFYISKHIKYDLEHQKFVGQERSLIVNASMRVRCKFFAC